MCLPDLSLDFVKWMFAQNVDSQPHFRRFKVIDEKIV